MDLATDSGQRENMLVAAGGFKQLPQVHVNGKVIALMQKAKCHVLLSLSEIHKVLNTASAQLHKYQMFASGMFANTARVSELSLRDVCEFTELSPVATVLSGLCDCGHQLRSQSHCSNYLAEHGTRKFVEVCVLALWY